MDIKDIENKFLTGDVSKEACAHRITLAIKYTGESQVEVSRRMKVTQTSLNNMAKGRQAPSAKVMHYLNDNLGIDYNFIIAGMFKQLPHQLVNDLSEQ